MSNVSESSRAEAFQSHAALFGMDNLSACGGLVHGFSYFWELHTYASLLAIACKAMQLAWAWMLSASRIQVREKLDETLMLWKNRALKNDISPV